MAGACLGGGGGGVGGGVGVGSGGGESYSTCERDRNTASTQAHARGLGKVGTKIVIAQVSYLRISWPRVHSSYLGRRIICAPFWLRELVRLLCILF